MEPILQTFNLTKRYKNFLAVDRLNFSVQQGDIYGFLGPNGAGKSTTIRMLLTLIQPSGGSAKLFGMELKQHRREVLRRIGALIEKPDFYKYLTAEENLRIFLRISGYRPTKKQIYDHLEMVGLAERAKSKVRTYSHGMKQRLGIAQALIHQPELLILDEPANGLDPQGQHEMRNLLQQINRDKGITILLSSHILHEIELIANRMAIIHKGGNVVEGDVENLLNSGEFLVTVETPDPGKAAEIARQFYEVKEEKAETIRVKLLREQIPHLTRALTGAEIPVYAVRPLRSLEQYFLKITSNA